MTQKDCYILEHVYDYSVKILSTLDRVGHDYETFSKDDDFIASVELNLIQIGEVVKDLSEDFRNETKSEIPWRKIKGLRNIIAHDYQSVEVGAIWKTAEEDVPALKVFCERYLCSGRGC